MNFQDITPKVSKNYEVGAILSDSWGYEQTNIDFYCIVKRTGLFITVLPMKQEIVKTTGFMSHEVKPTEIDFEAKPIRKKIKVWSDREQGFSFRNYTSGGWCTLWDGKNEHSTHYA